jgi:hypothetical protein
MRIGDLAAHDRHQIGVTSCERRLGVGRRAHVALRLYRCVADHLFQRRCERFAISARVQRCRHQLVEVEVAARAAGDVVHQLAAVVPGDDVLHLSKSE